MAVTAVRSRGELRSPESVTAVWEKRIADAKKDRGRFEPGWLTNLAFAQGKHYLQWSRYQRRLILPDNPGQQERYVEDVITQYRMTAIGELGADDDRPQLRFREADIRDREFAEQANRALSYAWDSELDAEEVLLDLRSLLVDLGTAALQCRFDKTVGPVRAQVPHLEGEPVYDVGEGARAIDAGKRLQFKDVHEGRLRWRLLTPFNLLVPPAVLRERDFPWEVIVSAQYLPLLEEEYGKAAADLKADDLSALNMMGASELADQRADDPTEANPGARLTDHVLVYECYERPTGDYPMGRTLVLAGSKFEPLRIDDHLPYKAPDGTPRSGVTYFHWWRLSDRFWSQGIVDKAKDAQRRINRRRNQHGKIIDRGLPAIFCEEGSVVEREGEPVEVIALRKNAAPPTIFPGVAPGPWMREDYELTLQSISRSTGIRDVSLGENPTGQNTYSGLQLLRNNDVIKLRPVLKRYRGSIRHLVEDTVYDIRRYWGPEKQIALAGDEEGQVDASVFDASKVPSFFMVEVAKGQVQQRDQAAELALIESVAQYSVACRTPAPLDWYADSLKGGRILDLPAPPADVHSDKAHFENMLLAEGHEPVPADYDPIQVHVPIHREQQIHAEQSGNTRAAVAVAKHIALHEFQAQQAAFQQAAQLLPPGAVPQSALPQTLPTPPGVPPPGLAGPDLSGGPLPGPPGPPAGP